jgi:hypothetical protein
MRHLTLTAITWIALLTAPAAAVANSYNGTNEIVSIGIHDSGHALVQLATASNTENCASPNLEKYILIPKTNPNFKLMYSTALLALTTGRPIQGWVNGCTDLWGGSSNLIPTATTMFVAK